MTSRPISDNESRSLIESLERLSSAHGASGYEDGVRRIVREELAGLPLAMECDSIGNLVVRPEKDAANGPVVMVDAHMDEIGLIISHVECNGLLRFGLIGGWDERVLPAHAVWVRTIDNQLHRGVIGCAPPHIQKPEERGKPYSIEQLFIDVGARSDEEIAEMGIAIGDSAVTGYAFERLTPGTVLGKALDNRVGCAMLVHLIKRFSQRPSNSRLVGLFSTFEETGGHGALAAAYRIKPDLAFVLEGTVAGDVSGVAESRCPSRQGSGPAITLADKTAQYSRVLVKLAQDIAAEIGVPCQLKRPAFGGTNGVRIQTVAGGAPTLVVSVPCRYIHSAQATARIEDIEATARLAEALVERADHILTVLRDQD